ncbi:hypothetical protein BH10PSE7_BH10PSE7_28960 [soil metagenome]
MKVAYALLAHENPALVGRLAGRLLEAGGIVAIHYDLKAGADARSAVEAAMAPAAGDVLWAERVSVGWGEWSIIAATLNCVQAIFDAGHKPDYIHLMSGADYPIRPIADFHAFLARNAGTEFLESHDMASNRWVVDGLTHERYRYSHFFNWKKYPHLFDWNWKIQRALKMRKKLPKDLTPHMGSQWCTLTGESWRKILALSRRRDVIAAFRRSWIPDEMFIQTLMATTNPQLNSRCMTLYQFTGQGVPVVYYNGHAQYLASQPFFFARKISPHAAQLRDELDRIVAGESPIASFADAEIGIRTTQYESFRQARRQPQPGRRTMGHVTDPWYGDLEWNEEPYVVFMGTSREELEWVSMNLPKGSRFASHGTLFAPDRINFAGGAARFAGYRDTDTALRDHKRTNFLCDVIQFSPGLITAFALPWKSDDYIRDVVRFDKRAHVVLVRGNTMRALLEQEYPRLWASMKNPTVGNIEPITVSAEEFRDFYAGYEQYYAERWSQLGTGGVKWIEIDILNVGWRRHLGDFLARIDAGARDNTVNLGYALAGSPSIHAKLSDPADAVRDISDNYAQITNPDRRSNHLDQVLSRIARPYAVLIGASKEELSFAVSLLERTGAFACHGSLFNPGYIEFAGGASEYAGYSAGDIMRRDKDQVGFFSAVMRRTDDKYAGFTIEWLSHPAFFERIARDRGARILVIHGNQLRSFLEYRGLGVDGSEMSPGHIGDPRRFEEFSRAHDRYFTGLLNHLKAASIAYSEADLLAPDFADDIIDFLNGIDDRLLRMLPPGAEADIQAAARSLTDPAALMENASYLYRRIVNKKRRAVHVGLGRPLRSREQPAGSSDA